jgi:hypothetical protein
VAATVIKSASGQSRRLDPLRATSGLLRSTDINGPAQLVLFVDRTRHWETIAYFTAFAAFSMSAAISRRCKRKIAWGPGSSMVWD